MIDLERDFDALRGRIDFPPSPDLARAVTREIHGARAPRPQRPRWWRPALVAAAIVAALTMTLAVWPAARHAVADLLGFDGATIRVTPSPRPSGIPTRAGDLELGDPVTLVEARAAVRYPIKFPGFVGPMRKVYLDWSVPGGQVSIVWEPSSALPRTKESGVGLLLSQFQGHTNRELTDKLVFGGGRVAPVEVSGERGFWITGEAHQLTYLDPSGEVKQDTSRLAGNTLLWESDGIIYRLESALTKARALQIARTLAPVRG